MSGKAVRFELDEYRPGDKHVTLYGRGTDFRAYVDVDDVDSGQVMAVATAMVEVLNEAKIPVPPPTPWDDDDE